MTSAPVAVPPDPLASASVAPVSMTERQARLIVRTLNGEVLGEYDLKEPETTIGRGSDNDIVLTKDKLVSRHQATVRFEEGYYLLCDLQSANGSYVNAKRVSSAIPFILEDGDSIRIGNQELLFKISDHDEAATVIMIEEEDEQEQEEAQSTERSSAIPSIQCCFTAFHPQSVVVDTWQTLLVYAYIEAAIRMIERDANKFDFDVDEPAHTTSSLTEQHSLLNRTITIIPECQNVKFNPQRLTFQWSGDWQRSAFRFIAKSELVGSRGHGKINIFVGPLLIAVLDFTLQCEASEATAGATAMASASTKPFKRIFPSYSRRDAPFIEAYQDLYKAPEFEFLAKVIKLREERNLNEEIQKMIDEAEVFQLFWSAHAHHSGYVLSELKYALQSKSNEDFIRPVYWEVPLMPVPEQLASYHFTYLPKYVLS